MALPTLTINGRETEIDQMSEILDAIQSLDGKNSSAISVATRIGELICHGGEDGEVGLTVFHAEKSVSGLLNTAENPDEFVVRTMAGQGVDVQRKFLVSKGVAIQATLHFIEYGELDPELTWSGKHAKP